MPSSRLVPGLGAAILATVLAACGASGYAGPDLPPPSPVGGLGVVRIAFVYETSTENFAQEMSFGAAAAAKAFGVKLINTAPPTASGSQQVRLFQAAEQTSKNGIALETLFPDLFTRLLRQAKEREHPDHRCRHAAPGRLRVTLFIGNDNYYLGVQLADALLPRVPKGAKGQILIGTDTPGLPVLTARNQGFETTVKKARPKVTFVNFDSTQEPSTNYSAWSSAVQSHPNALAYVGPGSQDEGGHLRAGQPQQVPQADVGPGRPVVFSG